MTDTLTYQNLLDEVSKKETVKNALYQFREEARKRFLAVGLPTKKNESWKYTSLEPILNLPVTSAERTTRPLRPEILKTYFLTEPDQERIVFVNGNYADTLSQSKKRPGVTIERFGESSQNKFLLIHLEKGIKNETNPFALVNGFRFQNGLFISIHKNEKLRAPIHILLNALQAETKPSDIRIVISLEENSSADIVFDHVGLSENPYFDNVVTEIHLAANSKIHWLNLTRESKKGFHFHTIRAHQKENSKFEALFVAQGSALTRNEVLNRFEGPNASSEVKSLSLLDETAEVHQQITADHVVGHCTSRQLFKTILAGSSKSEVNSLVYMHRDAQKSDSNQLIRNLLLSPSSRAFSRPQLQIHADDVKATHGAATGQLSKQELFYLKSRGLNEKQARFMLTYGFAEEIVEQIGFPSIRAQIEQMVQREIKEIVD